MRYVLLFWLSWFFTFAYNQETCSDTYSETIEYENSDALCDKYGSQTPTIVIIDGFASNVIGGAWNNEVVSISGTFTIDIATFSISNCIVQMAPGALILVNNSNELNVDNSSLFSCSEMWEGVKVLQSGLLTIIDSEIEDAQYAIYADGATGIKIFNNTFERNWVAARLLQKVSNPAANHVFQGNVIRGNLLKPPFSGQTPLPGTTSFAGIWASSVPFVWLGDVSNSPTTALNRFVDLKIGIISNSTAFTINRTSFETMINDGIVEGYQTGIGILAEYNSYIYQIGMGKIGYPAFSACQFAGIFLDRSTGISRQSHYVRLGKFGVRATSPMDHYVKITDNRFENTNSVTLTISAVFAERSLTGDDEINDNYVFSNTPSGASLIALNDMFGGNGEAEILRDTIQSIIDQVSGIEIRPGNGENFRVSENVIWADQLFVGLRVNYATNMSDNIIVSDNTIEVFNGATFLAYLNQAPNTLFCKNQLLGNGVAGCALGVRNNASGSQVGLNDIKDSQRGLHFLSSGINMGTQSHQGNTWQDGFPIWAAEHTASDFNLSQFEINTDLLNCGSPLYQPNNFGVLSVSPLSGWFFDIGQDCVEECTDLYDELKMNKVYAATANRDGAELGWSAAAEWVADAYLYHQLVDGTETGLTTEQLNTFQQAIESSEIAGIEDLQTQIRAAFQGTAIEAVATQQAHLNFEQAVEARAAILQNWIDNGAEGWPSDDENWNTILTEYLVFLDDRTTQQTVDLQEVLEQLTSPQGDIIEQQWYKVNRFLVEHAMNGELSDEDWTTLENIAMECYDTYGPAVSVAQSMLPVCRWQEYYELSTAACETAAFQLPRIDGVGNSLITKKMSLYPNPTNGLSRVNVEQKEEGEPGELILKNTYGQIIFRQPATDKMVDLQRVSPGIYVLEWWIGDRRFATEKVVKL